PGGRVAQAPRTFRRRARLEPDESLPGVERIRRSGHRLDRDRGSGALLTGEDLRREDLHVAPIDILHEFERRAIRGGEPRARAVAVGDTPEGGVEELVADAPTGAEVVAGAVDRGLTDRVEPVVDVEVGA